MQPITTTSELAELCKRLTASDFVAVDTEFLREQTFWPQLCLIQAAGPDVQMVVDPLAPGLDLTPFWDLMIDERVVKVFHAARQDIEIVYAEADRIPRPVFDTQVAAMVCGFGESVSYVNLVKKVTGHDIDKSSRFTDWSRRPLSSKQLAYALGDVTHLREIYRFLQGELDKSGRAGWLQEEMSTLIDPATYESDPEHAWQRLKLRVRNRKSLAVMMELAAWRERLAQTQDVPRARILRDEALYDIANHAPTEPEQLGELRTRGGGFPRPEGAGEMVGAVRGGGERDRGRVPPLKQGQPLSAEASATVELLKVLLKACAAQHAVAPRLIADSADLERIATEQAPDVPALAGWRRTLFGDAALKLKRGEIALALDRGEVVVRPLSRS